MLVLGAINCVSIPRNELLCLMQCKYCVEVVE